MSCTDPPPNTDSPDNDATVQLPRDGQPPRGEDDAQPPGSAADEQLITQGFSVGNSDQCEPTSSRALAQLGPYRLVEELARGGMGIVYRAQDTRLNRTVAVKTILAGRLAAAHDVQRFHMEAEAVARLDHPNITPIYEVGQHDGTHYFAMKFLAGGNLADRIPQWQSQPRQGVRLLLEVARAVHHAHQRGILHRDLKPQNIMLDEDEQPFVTDFGLAKFSQGADSPPSDSGLTQTGAVLGTPSYMAPEQAIGNRDVTTACDVYSLGAILYELITGKRPYQAESAVATMLLVIRGELIPPQKLNPNVDTDLDLICQKCLERVPAQRYATAEQLASDLHAYLHGEPISVHPPNWRGKLGRWLHHNARVATAAVATGMLFGTLLAVAWWLCLVQDSSVPYHRLPSVQRPLLSIEVPQVVARCAMFTSLLVLPLVGLVATLLGRQTDRGADLVVGLTVGLTMTLCALPVALCGPLQSFVLPSTTQDLELLQYSNPAQSDTATSALFDHYPDMRTIAVRERHLVLAHKIIADLMSNIIPCTAVTIGVSLSILLSVSISGTLLAGSLLRRADHTWGIVPPYLEIAFPMSIFAILGTLPLLGGLAGLSVTGFFGTLYDVLLDGSTVFVWLVVTMAAALLATVLAWRGSHRVWRVVSQIVWIACFFCAPLVLGKDAAVVHNTAFASARHLPGSALSPISAPHVYWTDADQQCIMRSDLDGNGPTRVLQGLNRPRGLAFHEGGLFFSDYGFGQIVRVNRSATSGTVLIPNALGVRGIAIDPAEKKLYWTDRDLRMVLRSNLDGSDEEVVISQHLAYPYSIQIDAVDKFVYVEDHLAGAIFRARFDGTELTRFADVSSTTQNRPGGLALDTIGRSLYYKDAGGRRILRAPLRGSLTQAQSHEVVLDGLANPNGLTIDPVARQLYWAESAIWRANLDGTDKQQLPYTDSSFIAGIHVVYP